MRDIFDDFEKVNPASRGMYWSPGLHKIRVLAIKQSDGMKGKAVIIEAECLESDAEDAKIGSTYAHVIKFTYPESALGEIKAFLMAAVGTDKKEEITKTVAEQCFSPEQPLSGVELGLQTWHVATSKGGNFTKHRYLPLEKFAEETK